MTYGRQSIGDPSEDLHRVEAVRRRRNDAGQFTVFRPHDAGGGHAREHPRLGVEDDDEGEDVLDDEMDVVHFATRLGRI